MRNFKMALAVGTTSFVALAFQGWTFAQAPNAQPGVVVQPGAAVQVNANANAAADEQHHTRQLVTHALNMAINGSNLQFAARAQGRRRQGDAQGDNRDRNQNADNRNDNNANNRNANDDNQRNENASNRRDGDQDRQANQEAIQQLRQLAWRQFESGNGLLHDADVTLNAAGNNAANARDERSAWTRRLHSAANQYATTLRSLSGVGSKAPEASTSGEADDQNNRERDRNRDQAQANRDQDQNRRSGGDQNANDGGLNRTEIAQIALLNQAIRESIEAFELNQSHHRAYGVNRAAPNNNAIQQLQGHSRQMASDSAQILQRVQASLNREGGQAAQNRDQDQNRRGDQDRNDRQENARNQGNNQGEQGRASVRLLAQQAQQVVETLQRIESAESAVAAPAR